LGNDTGLWESILKSFVDPQRVQPEINQELKALDQRPEESTGFLRQSVQGEAVATEAEIARFDQDESADSSEGMVQAFQTGGAMIDGSEGLVEKVCERLQLFAESSLGLVPCSPQRCRHHVLSVQRDLS
jgi:hypothetical protein